jgi:hypothetical protein
MTSVIIFTVVACDGVFDVLGRWQQERDGAHRLAPRRPSLRPMQDPNDFVPGLRVREQVFAVRPNLRRRFACLTLWGLGGTRNPSSTAICMAHLVRARGAGALERPEHRGSG